MDTLYTNTYDVRALCFNFMLGAELGKLPNKSTLSTSTIYYLHLQSPY